jgi:hypothetical protein
MENGKVDNWLSRRLTFWKHALWSPIVWVASGLFALYWILEFFRDEFGSPAIQDRFRLLNLIHHWQWRTWVLVVLGFLLASLLEGAFRAVEAVKDKLGAEIANVRKDYLTSQATIEDLRSRLMDKTPKVLAEAVNIPLIPGYSKKVLGFLLRNVGETSAMNVQIQDISNADFLGRFEIITQLLNGDPVSVKATIEQNGAISALFRHELNQLFKAGRPNDLKIETKLFPFRVTYTDLEGKNLFETVYEMTYNYFVPSLDLRYVRCGICGQIPAQAD